MKQKLRRAAGVVLALCALVCDARAAQLTDEASLHLPAVGSHQLRVLSPTLLEATLISTQEAGQPPKEWNFVGADFKFNAPAASEFVVTADGKEVKVRSVGFKRRPIYAPLKARDLRIGNYLYLQLETAIANGAKVEVKNPSKKLWNADKVYTATADPLRISPVIHVNQEGYLPKGQKKAMVGYYLGTMGEMDIVSTNGFMLLAAGSTQVVHHGKLLSRPDIGYEPANYQRVLEADFTEFTTPGEYRLQVPGLGVSYPFFIDEGIAASFARSYALGLYHQRCGGANDAPFTRYLHGACHTAHAEVPDMKFGAANELLAKMTGDTSGNKRHTAAPLQNVDASLYPYVTKTKRDVSGGHHDAGDYSKYTINSAQLVHALVFAADNFPGAGALDNLGIPESGDGKSDLLQEAKWETDFLAKMQDADGGFYFLVYPKERPYEHDVLPDKGDPQVVFPKTTSVTAAAVATLAQTGSSPLFKKQFPEASKAYLDCAKKGWDFLEKAIAKHGRDGSYQKITHYGDEFMHDDELAWAAAEMFAATGEEKYAKELIAHFNPADRETRKWTWWKMFEAYGCAVRSYAFAARSKRVGEDKLNPQFLKQCEEEIIAAAEDQLNYSQENSYGSSFPRESKRFRNAGWYFSSDRAFDLAVACQMEFPAKSDPRKKFTDAIVANFNYEAGCNPINVSFISGLGWKRPREMVHHVAQNDRRALPPSGLTWGNIQEGFPYLDPYQKELGALCFPPDWDPKQAYPFYDRWGDTFNTSQEFVVPNLARSLATAAFLMTGTSLTNQAWKPMAAQLVFPDRIAAKGQNKVQLKAGGLDFSKSRVVFEMQGHQPVLAANSNAFFFSPDKPGQYWLEAEAHLPDGRRVFAITNLVVQSAK